MLPGWRARGSRCRVTGLPSRPSRPGPASRTPPSRSTAIPDRVGARSAFRRVSCAPSASARGCPRARARWKWGPDPRLTRAPYASETRAMAEVRDEARAAPGFHQEGPRLTNTFEADPVLAEHLGRLLPPDLYRHLAPEWRALGEEAAGPLG